MTSYRRLFVAAALAAIFAHPAAHAQAQEPGTVAASETFLLDEYDVDVSAGPDSGRFAAGLGFGTAYTNGLWWTAGPRISWVRWKEDMPTQTGYGVGGAFGLGWRPEHTVSPYAGITLDRDWGVSGRFDWQTMVHAGARLKITSDPREYFAMTFSVYHANVFGGDGPSHGDMGIAMFYSAALFAKRK